MDTGQFSLFIKLIQDEYKLNEAQLLSLKNRLLADDKEFEKVWRLFKNKKNKSGVDAFKSLLHDLIS